ncbi:hypothetical protein HU200_027720 [Digitaria exilis]|uniref:Amine oxidase domain-containing protein n=1 Tax=Digitaria exilis TaxID=1010633 RepID=A0A835BWI6_9POAL|nr:hypothetical protein HU200_027720 [Digitaria exilis]
MLSSVSWTATASSASSHPYRPASARASSTRLRPVVAMAGSDDPRAAPARSVAVVGAGVSGLAAAYRLRKSGVNVTVFEAADRAGGKIRTNSEGGFLWDEGANTMTEGELEIFFSLSRVIMLMSLCSLGCSWSPFCTRKLTQEILEKCLKSIQVRGEPSYFGVLLLCGISDGNHIVNSHSVGVLNYRPNVSSIHISLHINMSSLQCFLLGVEIIELSYFENICSVGSFIERHFGREVSYCFFQVVDYLIDPFVAGTSAGDPESLSIRHAFPALWNLERKYGSIIVGAILSKLTAKGDPVKTGTDSSGKRRNRRASFSFHGGMQVSIPFLCYFQSLINALHNEVGDENVKLSAEVLSLACTFDGVPATGGWSISIDSKDAGSKHLATNQSFDAVIMTAPLSNVQRMKFRKGGAPFVLDFLPKVRSILKQLVTSDLKKLLGVQGQPTFVKHIYWRNAFPLYGRDYNTVLEAIEKMEKNLPGFFYAGKPLLCCSKHILCELLFYHIGNNKDGLAVGNVIASGIKAADLAISYLEYQVKHNDSH